MKMALISIKGLFKCGQLINESIIFNTRSIAISNIRRNNTVEEQKPEAQAPPPEKPNEQVEKLTQQVTDLTAQNTELIDKYKRALADGENLRTRLTKQIAEAKVFGIQNFCKDLLDVADVLGKATETVPKEEIRSNPHLQSLYEGLIMTEKQLQSVFKRHGLEAVNPLDEKFNPNFHEALFQQEVEGKAAGTVVIVSKIGYKLQDRVVRPALVGVSK